MPKAIGVGLALLVAGHWMLQTLIAFTTELFDRLPALLAS